MELATRWTAARQIFGLSYYKAGQLPAPCSAFQEDPEPRPTNLRARSSYLLILALVGFSQLAPPQIAKAPTRGPRRKELGTYSLQRLRQPTGL